MSNSMIGRRVPARSGLGAEFGVTTPSVKVAGGKSATATG
jgi:hypothetical protein